MYIRLPSFVKIWLCLWIWCLKYLAGKSPSNQNSGFFPLKFRKHGARQVLHLSWENLNFSRMVASIRKLICVTSKGIFRLRPTQIWRFSSQQFWNWEPLKHARTYTLYPVYDSVLIGSQTIPLRWLAWSIDVWKIMVVTLYTQVQAKAQHTGTRNHFKRYLKMR